MSSTSGGIGKNDDSANANKNKANAPQRESPQESIQSYSFFMDFISAKVAYRSLFSKRASCKNIVLYAPYLLIFEKSGFTLLDEFYYAGEPIRKFGKIFLV